MTTTKPQRKKKPVKVLVPVDASDEELLRAARVVFGYDPDDDSHDND